MAGRLALVELTTECRFRSGARGLGFIEEASMDIIGSAALALGVLIALGSILVTMSYLSE